LLSPIKVKTLENKDPKAMARGIAKVFKRKSKSEFTARIDEKGSVWILRR